MSKIKHVFTGVFIPANIWLSKELSPAEKMILGEVEALSKETGWCYAGRKHFTEWLHCTPPNVTYYISRLEEMGYLRVERKAGERSRMQIINERFYSVGSKDSLPVEGSKPSLPGSKEGLRVGSKPSLPGSKEGLPASYIKEKEKNKIQNKENAGADFTPPFSETGETTDLDGTLEAQQPEPTSPGGGAPGAIRVSITGPEHPDIAVNDVIEPKTDAPKTSRGKSKNPRTGTQDEIELATRVIEHLNQTAGRSFRVNTGENARGIIARHREGFTEAELLEVVEFKAGKWKADPEMYEYLNPVTLFRASNFERYLQAARAIAPKPQQQTTRSSIQHFGNGDYSKKQAF